MSSPINTPTGGAGMAPATLDALAADGEHAGWRVLDTARAQQFTGEIIFQSQPSVSVYLDSGHAYYAVRAGGPSICERLIDADVVTPMQIERGVIRIGDVENLGRLFDRDASVDRDAVMVVVELATDDVVTLLANTVTSSITLTAYRHHASGVHRWFVVPFDQRHDVLVQRVPVNEVTQIDTSITSEQPDLADLPDHVDDGVHIEWDESLGDDLLDVPERQLPFDESMVQSMLDAQVAASVADASPVEDVVPSAPAPAPVSFSFELPMLVVTDDNLPEDHQPEEVVDAVRRALDAIESASSAPAPPAPVAVADLLPVEPIAPLQFDAVDTVAEPVVVVPVPAVATSVLPPVVETAPSAFDGFPPPTMDDSAEAVYARAGHDEVTAAVAGDVVVDEVPGGSTNDRSGALQRLIGSLRRK